MTLSCPSCIVDGEQVNSPLLSADNSGSDSGHPHASAVVKPASVQLRVQRGRRHAGSRLPGGLRDMKHILVADDDPAIRRVLRLALEGLGYKVSEAADGKVAMERYNADKPDCVVTDLVMPGQEGIETIMQMRRHPHHAGIIAMSGYTGPRAGVYLNMARSLGADAILEKPFTVDQIKTTLEKVLGKAEGG